MGLEVVTREVQKETDKEKADILGNAKNQADEIVAAAKKKVRIEEEKAMKENEANIRLMEAKELASAKLQVKKNLLAAKKKIINEVLKEAYERISKFDKSVRQKHLSALLNRASASLKVGKVLVSENDIGLVENVPAEKAGIIGGLIASDADGTVRIDLSYDALLEQARNKHLAELASILFKK